ncbi:MAG: hypothetical protein JO257_20595 [Deltaproteobacteria bacterium]|nr:hypothetical protein [Deltaproteobacteria bacterium]
MKTPALLLALCGCDSLFGLDHVPPAADAAPPVIDSAARTVSCVYSETIASVAADGTPRLVMQPPPLNFAHAAIGDMQIPIAADGTFQFMARSGQPYELLVQSGGETAYFDRGADTCHLVAYFNHRPGALPVTSTTPLRFDITGMPQANTVVRITSTGQRTFLAPVFSGTNSWSLDWASALDLDGSPAGLIDASAGDRLYWVAMPISTDYYAITQAAQASVTMTNGSATIVAATPAALPLRCVHVQSGEGTLATMMQAMAPRGPGTPQSSWAITSISSPAAGIHESQPLALTTRPDVADHNVTVSYGNPYPGESDAFQVGVALAYKLSLGTGAATTIYSSVSTYDLIHTDASCSTTVTPQLPPVAFPMAPSLAGVALAADNQSFALDRSQPVPVHVSIDESTELIAFLDEVTVEAGLTKVGPVATFFPLGGDFAIDPSLLAVGHTYLFVLQARRGFPNALQFDYGTIAYPMAYAAFPTTSFTITR